MKIVLTGGGTGGHFTPILGVAQEINRLTEEQKLVDVELYYVSDAPFDERALFENRITFRKVEAGKRRTYRSIQNFFDVFKTAFGTLRAVLTIFRIYPDVVFSKGGYAAFPSLLAARLFRIPVVIHESDSVPGRVNLWAASFAEQILIAFPESAQYFPKEKTKLVGIPLRKEIMSPITTDAHSFLGLDPKIKTLFVVGGSLGAASINDVLVDILPRLVERFQVVHQTGKANYTEVSGRAQVALSKSQYKDRYKVYDYLDETILRTIAGAANLAVSRSGATSIFELAHWGIPAILIPITDSQGDHQRRNAFTAARGGGAVVLEERNVTPNILFSEITRLLDDQNELEKMKKAAREFSTPNASRLIAEDLIGIALKHEPQS